ncbi:MAG: amidohydrolase [Bacteroidales bacterium]|nr:amidohydrolase [Bacteroidales bacterium]
MDCKEIRHQLHHIAEPSNEEVRTSAYIRQRLEQFQPTQIVTFPKGNHLLAEFDFGGGGKTVLLRADMDAVRVNETLNLPYKSEHEGVSHKCGHDGHSTILLRLAEMLHEKQLPSGRVLLLFQGAEETGEGARQIFDSGILEAYSIDCAYALHNIPGEELGTIICKPGSFTCSVVSCDIVLTGKTAHAAEPWNAVSPFPAAQRITDFVMSLNQRDVQREDFCVATLIEFRVGSQAYGVAAGDGVLRFTIRTREDAHLQQIISEIETKAKTEAANENLQCEILWLEYFAASNNADEAVKAIKQCADDLNFTYQNKPIPFFWGEDFGLFTQHYPGALFGLGSGTAQPPLHHPDFDFPDDIVETGAEMFYGLAAAINR